MDFCTVVPCRSKYQTKMYRLDLTSLARKYSLSSHSWELISWWKHLGIFNTLVWVIWVTAGLPWLPVFMVTVELGVCWHHTPISIVITIWQHTLDYNWVPDRLVWVIWVTAGLPWLPVSMVMVELGVCWHHTPISIVITIWQHTLACNWVRGFTVPTHLGLN